MVELRSGSAGVGGFLKWAQFLEFSEDEAVDGDGLRAHGVRNGSENLELIEARAAQENSL